MENLNDVMYFVIPGMITLIAILGVIVCYRQSVNVFKQTKK